MTEGLDHDLERRRLLRFARPAAASPLGFGWLGDTGRVDARRPVHTWVTSRMTHVFALAHLLGERGALEVAAHGVRALGGALRDPEHSGWYPAVTGAGEPVATEKQAYPHAFVLLAAATARTAGIPGGEGLLAEASDVVRRHFLDDEGRVVEELDRTFARRDDYRGANAGMHMVEAFLAVGDVACDPVWHRCALDIAEHLVHEVARAHDYLLPEHFTAGWEPLPDYNRSRPDDPFRPFGVTPGHLLEWARLLVHLEAAVPDPPGWLLPDAQALFGTAVSSGWAVDGADGFVYTVDWDRRPVVRSRMHWVHAEALAAAAVLHRRTGDAAYARWYDVVADFCARHLVDRELGSWHHELDERNRPAGTTWQGKPDIYHAYQALLLAERPPAPSLAAQLAADG